MSIRIQMMTLGIVQTNAYLVADTETRNAILIDPVDEADVLMQQATDEGWRIALILATHAHFDHVLASQALKQQTGAPFYIHADCVPSLQALPQQGRLFGLGDFPDAAQPDRLLTTAPETIELDAIRPVTRYTPGHAAGHLAFYMPQEQIVFSGDALFKGAIGRTDLPGGDANVLMRAIFDQLLTLDDAVRVLPGHGPQTTIGDERRTNPFITAAQKGNL